MALTVSGASAFAPLAESSAFGVPAGVLDSVEALIDGRAAGGGTASAAERDAFAAAIRLQNPDVHIADTTDCASCHLAEGARRIGEAVYGLHAGQDAFTSTRSLARRNEGTSVTNLHAFGYLGRQISIMQRTANESAVAASRMEAKIQ